MEFSRQESGVGSHSLLLRSLPNPGIKPTSPMSPALAGRFFTTSPTWEAQNLFQMRLEEPETMCCRVFQIIFLSACYLRLSQDFRVSLVKARNILFSSCWMYELENLFSWISGSSVSRNKPTIQL